MFERMPFVFCALPPPPPPIPSYKYCLSYSSLNNTYSHHSIRLYTDLYHFLFTLNFIFALTSYMPYLLHRELLLCACMRVCEWSFLPCSLIFFSSLCHFDCWCHNFFSFSSELTLPYSFWESHLHRLLCSVLSCHFIFKLIALSGQRKEKKTQPHRLCTYNDCLTLFRCICRSAFSFVGVNIWWRKYERMK